MKTQCGYRFRIGVVATSTSLSGNLLACRKAAVTSVSKRTNISCNILFTVLTRNIESQSSWIQINYLVFLGDVDNNKTRKRQEFKRFLCLSCFFVFFYYHYYSDSTGMPLTDKPSSMRNNLKRFVKKFFKIVAVKCRSSQKVNCKITSKVSVIECGCMCVIFFQVSAFHIKY